MHDIATRRAARHTLALDGRDGGHRKRAAHLVNRLGKRCARFGFTAATAVRAARAFLQLSERLHAACHLAVDVMVGNRIAAADIHAAYENANANDCQQCGMAASGLQGRKATQVTVESGFWPKLRVSEPRRCVDYRPVLCAIPPVFACAPAQADGPVFVAQQSPRVDRVRRRTEQGTITPAQHCPVDHPRVP